MWSSNLFLCITFTKDWFDYHVQRCSLTLSSFQPSVHSAILWLFTFGLLLYAHVAAPNSTSSWGHGTTGNTNRCFNCRTTDGAVIRIFIITHHFKSNAAVVRRQRIWVCCLNIVLCSLLFGVQRVVPCEVWSRIPLWYVCVDPALVCSCCNKKNIWKRTEDGVILCVVFVMFLKSICVC